jgi:hypothetical protein
MLSINTIMVTFILLLVSFCTSAAQVYKWTDKEGSVHYSDVPQGNATIVPIRDNEKLAVVTPTTKPSPNRTEKKSTADNSITIEQPKDQETLQNTGGELAITIASATPLAQGDKWQVMIDGKKLGDLQSSNNITLQNIERGEHTLQIYAVDTHGKVLASSAIITFYMHQATAKP